MPKLTFEVLHERPRLDIFHPSAGQSKGKVFCLNFQALRLGHFSTKKSTKANDGFINGELNDSFGKPPTPFRALFGSEVSGLQLPILMDAFRSCEASNNFGV